MKDEIIETYLPTNELAASNLFDLTDSDFLEKSELLDNCWRFAPKTNFLHSHLKFFPQNFGYISNSLILYWNITIKINVMNKTTLHAVNKEKLLAILTERNALQNPSIVPRLWMIFED